MLSLTRQTKLKPEEVFKQAETFFGTKGLGLTVKEREADSIYLEGGGGGVRITTTPETKGTKVDVETREWEIQTKKFITLLK
jgi:hypothetical protein